MQAVLWSELIVICLIALSHSLTDQCLEHLSAGSVLRTLVPGIGRKCPGLRHRLMADQVREQVQGGVMQVAGVGPGRFVSCAEASSGRLHIGKTDVGCGRRWVHRFDEIRQCLRAVALGVSGGEVQVLDP